MAEAVTLLLDSDIIAYKFAAAAQTNFDWDGDGEVVSVVDELEEVTPLVKDYISDLVAKLKATDVIVCLSCPSSENFRYTVLPSYKHNRVGVAKPELLQAVKDWMRENYNTYERPTLEADDIMGILATHPTLIKGKKIIVSEDKDMKTIPAWVFNPEKDDKPRLIAEEEADYWHYYQTLIGDTTDGYSGCEGVGPKTAEEFLKTQLKVVPYEHVFKSGPRKGLSETRYSRETSDSPWETILSLYSKAGFTEADALVQARVARICRFTDYDFKKKEVILWKP